MSAENEIRNHVIQIIYDNGNGNGNDDDDQR